MRKSGRQEKRFSERVLSCFHAFLMNPSGPLRLCASAFKRLLVAALPRYAEGVSIIQPRVAVCGYPGK
jgi:hypothetical protein